MPWESKRSEPSVKVLNGRFDGNFPFSLRPERREESDGEEEEGKKRNGSSP